MSSMPWPFWMLVYMAGFVGAFGVAMGSEERDADKLVIGMLLWPLVVLWAVFVWFPRALLREHDP